MLRWIVGRNTSPASPTEESIVKAPANLDRDGIAFSVSERELDMLVAALRVAEVRRGWVLQIRGDSSIEPLSDDEVTDLRHRMQRATRSV